MSRFGYTVNLSMRRTVNFKNLKFIFLFQFPQNLILHTTSLETHRQHTTPLETHRQHTIPLRITVLRGMVRWRWVSKVVVRRR